MGDEPRGVANDVELVVCKLCRSCFNPLDLDSVLFHSGRHIPLPDAQYTGAKQVNREPRGESLAFAKRLFPNELKEGMRVVFDGGAAKSRYGPAWATLIPMQNEWWLIELDNGKKMGMQQDTLLDCCFVPFV